jgi:hypothetical protein
MTLAPLPAFGRARQAFVLFVKVRRKIGAP